MQPKTNIAIGAFFLALLSYRTNTPNGDSMGNYYNNEDWYDIDTNMYEWSVKAFRSLKKMLRVNLQLHGEQHIHEGDIFLFNHFSRFETFIPQFLIYQKTKAYSCAIASGEFFAKDDALSRYLKNVGVIPHDHPRLFPILATHILHGHKVIIFPEGCMVKDRRVLNTEGEYSIYSRTTGERRKHHTGAAVLAQGLEAFKATIRNAYSRKDFAQLRIWQEQLKMDSVGQLLAAALKPTLVVPANITFYPIRASENLLHQAVKLFSDNLTLRQTEELLVEGNIMLKDTDMDLNLGEPVDPYHTWHWWNRFLLEPVAAEFASLEDVFNLHSAPKNFKQKLLGYYFKKNAETTRNTYMEQIYRHVTINLSHLASTLIMEIVSQGQKQIEKHYFYNALYIAIKRLQQHGTVNLHNSLLNPEDYGGLPYGKGKRLEQFIQLAENSNLIAQYHDVLHFLPKLRTEFNIDTIRMENTIAVYANEAEPITLVRTVLAEALKEYGTDMRRKMAEWSFEDECRSLHWAKQLYTKPRYDDINRKETADADPTPFLFIPKKPNGIGILLLHGLLASPAELRAYGVHLVAQGYTVLGIRLKGHGTSPYDLMNQTWESWYDSAEKAHTILNAYCERIVVIGFSTGGALAMKLASDHPDTIKAIAAVSVPVKFINPAFMLVPLLHGANKLVDWAPRYGGFKTFLANEPEHPNVNYRSVPVKCLFELRQFIQNIENLWPKITVPTLIMHAENDPVVNVESSYILLDKLGSEDKRLVLVKAEHHGILMDNTEGCWASIDNFLRDIRLA